ncbi:ABC transporter ATP-binding protein [Streptomyces sp. DSM 40750]|uniref:ABC transporter ATP-binding protein n=1 Tax=Streptomyces sp. DSM 40750 TaxID=2801030 RepID=UPI00214B4494|nr:ATP-binding cassette domain-containing protein [Streptomyces sp. DSM 40750]UUU24690.1 ATP-binding cassette domain-containing protein [Streptomyces sp. DSM 40750]
MSIVLSNCTYAYRRWRAPVFEDLNYALPEGLTILLGPNGAGKSTLLKLASGAVRPRSGTVSLGSLRSTRTEYLRSVSWMPQNIVALSGLTAREYVAYCGWLKGMSKTAAWEKAAASLTRVELEKVAQRRTSQLSGGQLRRVGLACALVHDAQVILMDEPTAGMDPRQRRVFRNILNDLSQDVRVLMSTHDVTDLAEEADHVTVMNHGRILLEGSTKDFLSYKASDAARERAAESAYTEILARDEGSPALYEPTTGYIT